MASERSSCARNAGRRAFRLVLPVVILFLVLGPTLAPAQAVPAERITKHFVKVWVPSIERVAELNAAGFDIAGVDRDEMTVGLVVTGDELDRLRAFGWPVTIEQTRTTGEAVTALQDYTDPQELSVLMDQIVASHPTLARKITLTDPLFEGQRVHALKITRDVDQPNDRPSFLLDCQHHAREVMTAEIARDMMNYLTSQYSSDARVRRWVDNINIYIVPSVNPDGAMYVFTGDSMWRKNRNPVCAVDNNRNYPHAWGSCNGSSGSCTSDTYRGPSAASEPETQAMIQLVSDVRPFFALSYHSYGQYLMYPYGCTDPDEMAALDELAQQLNGMLENDSGAVGQYTVGPIWSAIYIVDGGSIDTQYARYGAYGYTIEVNSSAQGFQPDYATWRDVTVVRQRVAWQFFLDKTLDGAQIRGTVTDAGTGLPLPANVSVQEVSFTHGEWPRQADANGRYHWLARANQTYHVTFSMPGYCATTRAVTVGTGPAVVDASIGQPQIPGGVSAAANGDNRIDVFWDPAANADEYRVLRATVAGGPYTQVAAVAPPQTSFQDTTVSGGITYFYVVRSFQGCESGDSAEASAEATGACIMPPSFAGIAAVANAGLSTCSLNLTWPAATAHCGGGVTYRVYRSTSASFTPSPETLVASGLAATSFTDHDALANDVTYHYILRAVDSANGVEDANTVRLSGAPTGPSSPGTWSDNAGDTKTAKLVPSAPWSILPTGGKTGPKVYATGAYGNNVCASLTTPPISIQAGSSLFFASKYDIQANYDAGIVEVAVGPAFDTWTKLTVNYPDPLANAGNACGIPTSAGSSVFSRSYPTPAYPPSSYSGSLAGYSGRQIKLRWRISTDGSTGRAGWWVDDISVTNALIPAACSPGTAPNPREVGPDGFPMFAFRGAAGESVELSYTPGCGALDNAVYWGTGPIVGAPVWTDAACGVGTTGEAVFDPGAQAPGQLTYFVIVGQNRTKEGSYGFASDGVAQTERPEASGVGACDRPQDLTGSCP